MNSNSDKHGKIKKKSANLVNVRWVVTITIVSFLMSAVLSFFSERALGMVGNIMAFLVLLFFILVGIFFDIIGVSATAATEKRFHSMAARRVRGARQAIWIVRNAEKVGSFCNDVVGDISGIISGATSAIIVSRLIQGTDARSVILSLSITGCVSALTIGGKALGKTLGLNYSEDIVGMVGRLMAIFPDKKDKR